MKRLRVPVNPVPASRPRVSRYGVYYSKTYKAFRKKIEEWVETVKSKLTPTDAPVEVHLLASVQQPKSTKLDYPRGDCDNFAKAILDALNELTFEDDNQVVALHVYKQWAPKGEEGQWIVRYSEVNNKEVHLGRVRKLFGLE